MSRGTRGTVECPLCGEAFDPSGSGGLCTNSDCGEWRYRGTSDREDAELVPDGGVPETGDRATGEGADDAEVVDEESGKENPDDESTEGDNPDDEAEPAERGVHCPECGAAVEAVDNFCHRCGADVSYLGVDGLSACPECGSDVEADDRFCRNCGENLVAYRPGGSPDDEASAADADSADGGAPEAEDGGAPEAEDGGAPEAEVESAGDSVGTEGRGTPPDVDPMVIVVRNHEIQVEDGETLGREIRNVIMETGGDESDAVRVHREHLRVEYEDGQYYVVDLGENPTVVNGEYLEQGDRAPVSPGDRIKLSDVARARVEDA